jgi:hypothetical protein
MNTRRIAVYLVVIFVSAVVGAALCGWLGFWLWRTFKPEHGCGNIGCYDALYGAFYGVAAGGLALPIGAVLWMRRRH